MNIHKSQLFWCSPHMIKNPLPSYSSWSLLRCSPVISFQCAARLIHRSLSRTRRDAPKLYKSSRENFIKFPHVSGFGTEMLFKAAFFTVQEATQTQRMREVALHYILYVYIYILVGGLEHVILFIIYGIILPIDQYFSRWVKPPTIMCLNWGIPKSP